MRNMEITMGALCALVLVALILYRTCRITHISKIFRARNRWVWFAAPLLMLTTATESHAQTAIPDKTVVLTLDDAVKSQRTFVAPLLKQLGFGATFFVTHEWMRDKKNFLTWEEIAEMHRMGFEIGNHTWTHCGVSSPKIAARLPAELALVENALRRVGVPKPISFAYPGNGFGPEAVRQLQRLGYQFARRGMQPEIPYGKMRLGPAFDPKKYHPLLIPTTADAYPDWTFDHFKRAVARACGGKIVILQFHGVPDVAHPWVNTPPERFREYMNYLKEEGFHVIAMRDLAQYVSLENPPTDPMLNVRYPHPKDGKLQLPVEMEATRANPQFWLTNMLIDHRYTWAETAGVTGWDIETVKQKAGQLKIDSNQPPETPPNGIIRIRPYPGGRHPRIGFLEGAICPRRGTKASIFLPWNPEEYLVLDLPEAIWCNKELLYLAHTHIPTIWDKKNIWIDNVDWVCNSDGSLSNYWELPNGVAFGASLHPSKNRVDMEFWLKNGSPETLTGLRTQVCVMLKGVREMNAQTNANKKYDYPVAAVKSAKADRWVLTAWDRCGKVWGNADVPCFHSDPVFPDCAPGETVRVTGRIWFYRGQEIGKEIEQSKAEFKPLARSG